MMQIQIQWIPMESLWGGSSFFNRCAGETDGMEGGQGNTQLSLPFPKGTSSPGGSDSLELWVGMEWGWACEREKKLLLSTLHPQVLTHLAWGICLGKKSPGDPQPGL